MKKSGHSGGDERINLIKLCVGIDSVDALIAWRERWTADRRAAGEDTRQAHTTRSRPKNADRILAAHGSIYWVMAGFVQARQRIEAFEAVEGADGITRCRIVLDPAIVRTAPRPRRPFQGWRYLTAADAPPDLTDDGGEIAAMPPDMREALARLGVL